MKLRWFLPGFLSVFVLGAPTPAATIRDWHFDANQNQLEFTTDEDVQPRVQLIPNPTRLVIDLPGIVLGHPQVNQPIGSVIQEIRVGQFDAHTTRLVIALAPGYTLNPAQVEVQGDSPTHWHVTLPMPQVSLAVGTLPGTLPAPVSASQEIRVAVPQVPPAFPVGTLFAGGVRLNASLNDLQAQVRDLMTQYSFLKTGMFFLDLDTGNYLNIGGDRVFPAASTIKLPILIAFFQDFDAGKVSLDESLVMRADLVTDGSGDMQDEPIGTRFTALETIRKMIMISDNTATNMIIDRLGGIDTLNQRFRSWGLQDTVMHNWLSDLQGTNITSSQDMVRLLALVVNDKLLSPQSKAQALDILRHTTIRTLLPAGLGPGADIADKTGDIGFLIGDAGLITMPNGKRYLAGIFVERPYDDTRGRDFIRLVSQLVYNYLDQSDATFSANPPANQLTPARF